MLNNLDYFTLNNLFFHHIGIACSDIEKDMKYFSLFGYKKENEDFIDLEQGIKGRFLISKDQPRLELIENYGKKGVLDAWLKRDTKMYHTCYETSEFNKTIIEFEKIGARVIVEPVKATAFNNREITFLMLPNKLFIELLNKP